MCPSSPAQRASSTTPRSSAERDAEVGERRAADAGAVERQRLAEDLRRDAADRLEQRQVRAVRALLAGDADDDRRARIAVLVQVMAEAGHEPPAAAPRANGLRRSASQPASSVGSGSTRGQRVGEERAGVLADAEEARPAAEQAGRERALDRVRRAR